MSIDEAVKLLAMVLAWQDGGNENEIEDARTDVTWLDTAQQCLDDLQEMNLWMPR